MADADPLERGVIFESVELTQEGDLYVVVVYVAESEALQRLASLALRRPIAVEPVLFTQVWLLQSGAIRSAEGVRVM